MRYDWLFWLVTGICLLRKQHMALAGIALTYATLLRVFPGLVVATLILKALAAMLRERRVFLSRAHRHFAAGCIATLAVLVPASSWATEGLDAWAEFAHNSEKHMATALTNNMGLKTLLGYDFATRAAVLRDDALADPFENWSAARRHLYHARASILVCLVILFGLLLARAADREQDDWAAACLGVGLIAIATELTCYYYGFLLSYGLLWERRRLPAILGSLLAAFTCLIATLLPWHDDRYAAMSLGCIVVVVAVTAQAAFGRRRDYSAAARSGAEVGRVGDHVPAPGVPRQTRVARLSSERPTRDWRRL